jgi:hypothetical protein
VCLPHVGGVTVLISRSLIPLRRRRNAGVPLHLDQGLSATTLLAEGRSLTIIIEARPTRGASRCDSSIPHANGGGNVRLEVHMKNFGNVRVAVMHREGDKDWAGTGRYLSILAYTGRGDSMMMGPDIPISSEMSDAEIERISVLWLEAVCGKTEQLKAAAA